MTYRTTRWLPVLGLGAASLMACSSPKDEAPVAKSSQAVSTTLVISQVYGGGGATTGTPTYKYDFIEITNIGTAAVSLSGMSLQYVSAAGPSTGGWTAYNLPAVSLDPGKRYLFQVSTASGTTLGADLPVTADNVTTVLNMSATAGKIALVGSTTALTCGAAATRCPTGSWIDMVGYGAASDYEGTPTAVLTNTSGLVRKNGGCQDTDDNSADFEIVTAPVPRNNASAAVSCGSDAGTDADGATDAADAADAADGAGDSGADASDAADAADASDGAADSGAADSGAADSGAADSGAADSGAADSGAADSGAADSGAADSGAADSGAADSGAADSGAADSGAADSGAADSAAADTTVADTTVADTTVADTTAADTTAADSTAADSADDTTPPEDTGTAPTDTGSTPADTGSASDTGTDGGTIAPAETETDAGCGCATPGTSSSNRTTQGALAAFVVAGLLARRRRR